VNSLYQSAKCSISNVKQRVPLTRSESWTVEDEQCQKIGGGYKAVKFGFLLFLWIELDGANILSTPIQSPMT
jgi:hypothetical protein